MAAGVGITPIESVELKQEIAGVVARQSITSTGSIVVPLRRACPADMAAGESTSGWCDPNWVNAFTTTSSPTTVPSPVVTANSSAAASPAAPSPVQLWTPKVVTQAVVFWPKNQRISNVSPDTEVFDQAVINPSAQAVNLEFADFDSEALTQNSMQSPTPSAAGSGVIVMHTAAPYPSPSPTFSTLPLVSPAASQEPNRAGERDINANDSMNQPGSGKRGSSRQARTRHQTTPSEGHTSRSPVRGSPKMTSRSVAASGASIGGSRTSSPRGSFRTAPGSANSGPQNGSNSATRPRAGPRPGGGQGSEDDRRTAQRRSATSPIGRLSDSAALKRTEAQVQRLEALVSDLQRRNAELETRGAEMETEINSLRLEFQTSQCSAVGGGSGSLRINAGGVACRLAPVPPKVSQDVPSSLTATPVPSGFCGGFDGDNSLLVSADVSDISFPEKTEIDRLRHELHNRDAMLNCLTSEVRQQNELVAALIQDRGKGATSVPTKRATTDRLPLEMTKGPVAVSQRTISPKRMTSAPAGTGKVVPRAVPTSVQLGPSRLGQPRSTPPTTPPKTAGRPLW